MRIPFRGLGHLMALAGLVGCGVDPRAAQTSRLAQVLSDGFPLRLENAGRELRLPAPPLRILPANAAWVDTVSLLVGPERVVALPPEAFGYSRLAEAAQGWEQRPPFPVFEGERILALEPDLVLAHDWQDRETLASLERAGLPVLVLPVPESWEEVVATLDLLGTVLDVTPRARTVLRDLEIRRAALARRARRFARLRGLSYTNLGAGGWTVGARTTGQILFLLAGVRNAAAEAGLVGDVPADAERLLALAPDFFLVGRPDRSESSPPSATFLAGEPALQELAAVRAGRIASLSPALFNSASPELLRGAEALVDELERWEREGRLPSPR